MPSVSDTIIAHNEARNLPRVIQSLACADEVIVVADHTKVGRQALAFLCELAEVDAVIVDKAISDEQKSLLASSGTKVILASTAGEGVESNQE